MYFTCKLVPVSLNFIQPAAIFLFNLSWSLGFHRGRGYGSESVELF